MGCAPTQIRQKDIKKKESENDKENNPKQQQNRKYNKVRAFKEESTENRTPQKSIKTFNSLKL